MLNKTYSLRQHCVSCWTAYIYYKMIHGSYNVKKTKSTFTPFSRYQRQATNIPEVNISLYLNRKVKFVCVKRGKFIPLNAIIAYWVEEVELQLFLTFSLHGGEWSASQPGRLTKENGCPRSSLSTRLGGCQSLIHLEKRKAHIRSSSP